MAFKYALTDRRVWILATVRGNRILAYSIFLRKDIPALQITRMMLIDFQTLDGRSHIWSRCFSVLSKGVSRTHSHAGSYWVCRRKRDDVQTGAVQAQIVLLALLLQSPG